MYSGEGGQFVTAIGKNLVFTVCKMSENVLFFEHMHSKFAKNAQLTDQKFVLTNSLWVSKSAELC